MPAEPRMTPSQLRYAIAVANRLSFAKAADQLGVSPASLSEQIQKLELELGIRLFDRTTRTISVTPAGREVIDQAQRVIDEIGELQSIADAHRTSRRGTVVLGNPPHATVAQLAPILSTLAAEQAGLVIRLVEAGSDDLLDRVRRAGVDLSLLTWASANPPTGVGMSELGRGAVGIALPSSHALAKESVINLHDLADMPFIAFTKGTTTREISTDVFARAEREPKILFESSIPEMICRIVAGGHGFALLSESRAREYSLPWIACTPRPQEIVYGITWPRELPLSAAARFVRDQICTAWQKTGRA